MGGGPQQEIIIWAIVGFVKGLAWMKIGQDALLYPSFLCNTLSALISDKSGSLGWRNVCLCCASREQRHMSLKLSPAPAAARSGETSTAPPGRNQ